MNWLQVCSLDDIPRLGSRVIQSPAGNIAVFRNNDNEVFALNDRCPHKGGPLSQGIVFDRRVTCPLHNWVISLETGDATGPDVGCTQRYDICVEDGTVYIALPDDGAVETEDCLQVAEA